MELTRDLYKRRILPSSVAFLVVLGIALRFYGIHEHFGHIDDLVTIAGPYMINQGLPMKVSVPGTGGALEVEVDAHRIKTNPLLYAAYVSATQTYAPLQFFLYPLLLSGDYSYREFLIRGRLPSALFSSLALLFFVGLYRAYNGHMDSAGLLALCTMSLSLMNIVYAQQAMSYAIGVTACTALIWMLVHHAGRPTNTKILLLWALLCATLAYANYQVLMLIPAAYVALFASEFNQIRPKRSLEHLRRYAISGAVFIFLVLPLYIIFLRDKSRSGHLLGTPGFEQYFLTVPSNDFLSVVRYVIQYAATGIFTVVDTNVTFAMSSGLALVCVGFLFALWLVGTWGLASSREPVTRALAIFIGLVVVIWGGLNATGRFPISPTRHVLVLTPIVVLTIAIGVNYLRQRFKVSFAAGEVCIWGLMIIMLSLFAMDYGQFRSDRKDKFDEAMMSRLLAAHQLDTIVGYGSTWNPALMFKRSEKPVTFIDLDAIIRKGPRSKIEIPNRSFLLVSHKWPIEQDQEAYSLLQRLNFNIRHVVDLGSDTEVHLSKEVKYGSNGLYVAVAEKQAP